MNSANASAGARAGVGGTSGLAQNSRNEIGVLVAPPPDSLEDMVSMITAQTGEPPVG
jgi:hypothetical protein